MSVTTKIQVALEVSSSCSWDDKTTIEQVKKQAMDNAMEILSKTMERSTGHVSVVGVPKCVTINFKEGK